MNRTVEITINGVEYPLCYSTAVVCRAEDEFHGLSGFNTAIRSDSLKTKFDAVFWMLSQMLLAGQRYEHLRGCETPEPPSKPQLYDMFGVGDLVYLVGKINEAVAASSRREVDVETPKNATATPGA